MNRARSPASLGVAAVAAAAMLLSACSLQPVYRQPEAPVPATFPSGPVDAPAAGGPSNGALPASDIGWRDFLTDPRLQRLVEIALANNRDLRVAALNVAQVQAQYRIQRAALFPQVNAVADGSASRSPARSAANGGNGPVTHDDSAGVSAAWELDFFGKTQSLDEQALQQYLASAQARKALEILLVSQVADQYLAMLAYDELLAVTQRTLETAQKSYELTTLQLRAGSGTELAVQQALTVVEQARTNHAAQVRGRAQAENGLVLLLGQPIPANLPPPVPFNEQQIVSDLPPGLPSQVLTRRPDVMQAEAMLKAANANIGAARAAFFPSISLTGNLGSTSTALAGLFGAGTLAWSFVPALTVPIFQAGKLQASLDVATLEKDINVARYEKAIQTAFSEVANGLAARQTYSEEVASLERLTAADQRSLELSQLMFRNGATSYLAVLTAQNSLYGAQVSVVQTRLARLTSLVDLYRQLGGGWIRHTGDTPRPADVAASRPAR